MNKGLIAITLMVQVATVGVLFALTGEDTQAYPMEAGYVTKDQNLQVVYYDGTPAQMTYDKMESPIKRVKTKSGIPGYLKKIKNLRCERRELEGQSSYRCALDFKKASRGGI